MTYIYSTSYIERTGVDPCIDQSVLLLGTVWLDHHQLLRWHHFQVKFRVAVVCRIQLGGAVVLTVEDSQVEIVEPAEPVDQSQAERPLNYYERMFLEKNPIVQDDLGANEKTEKSEIEEVPAPKETPPPTETPEEPETPQEPEGPPHHMLDEYQEKVLLRSQQDALYAEVGGGRKGKGRGKGKKGKGKGKDGKGKGKGRKNQGQVRMSAMKKKPKKDPVARVLFPSEGEEEQKDDGAPTGSPAKSRSTPSYKKPASAKAKASPGSKAKAKAKSKSKARAKEIGEVGDEKGPKKGRQSKPSKPDDDESGKPKIVKQEIPTFQCSVVVPYWSRGACGLKVPQQQTDGGIASKTWWQVFYLGVRGASMKEHIDIIAAIVT